MILFTKQSYLEGIKDIQLILFTAKNYRCQLSHFDVQNLYPGTTYFFNVKTENNAFVGPASNITTVVTPYDKPHGPPITVKKLGMQKTVLTLHSVSDETGPIRFYQLTIKKDRKIHCSYIPDNTTLLIATAFTHVPLNVDIHKGVEDVTIAGTIIKFSLTETYLFCWRAVLNETGVLLYSINKGVLLARNDLRAIGKATMVTSNTVLLKLSAGPSYIRYYQIIVAEDSINSSYPEPTNLTPYFDSVKPSHPYITSEFSAAMFNELRNFVVGNEKTYVSSVHDIKFFNVKLKPGTTYSIYLKSLYNETIFFSSPWSYFITLPQVVKATQSIVLARTGLETFISWSICRDFEIDTISCLKNNSVVALGTNKIFISSNGFSKKVVTQLKDKTYKLKIKNVKLEDSGTYNCKVLAKIQSQPKYFTESIKLVVTDIPLSYNISAQCNVRIKCNYRNVYFNSKKLEKDQLKKLFSSFVEAVFTRVKILFYELSASGSNILTEKGFVTENSIEFVITLQHNITADVKEIEKLVHFILQRNRYKLFLHSSDFQADIIMTSMVVKDFNECESSAIKYCDDNAVCMNLPDWLSYACACSKDYQGNGFSCVKKEKEKSSKQYIIITGSIVTIILLIIIFACIVQFKRLQKTKSTEKSLPEPVYTDLPYVTNASVIHNPVTDEVYEDVKESIELKTHYTGLVPTEEDVTYSQLTSNKNKKSEYYENS
ncbi:uncharacterized protein LOC130629835 [Hydractinia symbiolongicarpus]|uniref:uncharacterized protein LOC130629835 n=1 Tax=Hydractinia symbiolongicarpus TaxID=13093 RepID=UPI00254D4916|nr:uncharacterized protein LOC130629835 [Hydractinia symbiolongicarpus]